MQNKKLMNSLHLDPKNYYLYTRWVEREDTPLDLQLGRLEMF